MATFEQFRSTFPEDSNEKGEAFEVFLAEWLFKNHPVLSSEYKKIWRFSDWPKAWSSTDIGTDLIAENQHGKICAIQAKFYKETSTIPKSDIDSFLSDTNRPEVDFRLLVATTDGLGKNASNAIEGQEKPVRSFTLKDFLEPFDWPESLESLHEYQPREPHQPRPHQKAAIDDVTNKIESRGQLLMACGTGKTLTGQRIAERLEAQSTLVLLPSLLLLSKTVKDWVSEREQDFIFLPVCSDKSVTKQTDEIAVNDSELCFRSTTDAKEIADFLRRPENKVIFSTYQSSPQIAEAFEQYDLAPFDLILADEAHRCAGKISNEYSTVLSETLIPANKRLFMTATPRMYTSRIKKKAKDAEIEIASMDDESVFGPVLHHLTFGQAIANDPPLLTDYRVLVVGVNDEVAKQMVEERAFVKTEGGLEDNAQSIATQLGLSKAVRDYDLKRVISFHSRVNYAKNFANSFQELQQDLKPQHKPNGRISYSHVSGAMPTSERTKELRALGALENEDRYIVGNARCLSEGVDVPSLDGIAFVDPRRSEIDIIQAVGRAIRLSEGKDTGTIVIPVFISDEDDPDEVLSSSQFDQVWKVVNALRSHDESLGEMLDQFRVGLGRKQKVSFKDTKIVFDVPTKISEDFVAAFETKLVETTTDSWEFWYGVLLEYYADYGHANVGYDEKYLDRKLGLWVQNQRARRALLTPKMMQCLDAVNFIWDVRKDKWETHFSALEEYRQKHGHCSIPAKAEFAGLKLGQWVSEQRLNKRISDFRRKKLNQIGFEWNIREAAWLKNFHAIKEFQKEFGVLPPRKHKLGLWLSNQLRRLETSAPEGERFAMLQGLRSSQSDSWSDSLSALIHYKREYGHCDVPQKHRVGDIKLGYWVSNQRQAFKKAKLSDKQIASLNEVGFTFDPKKNAWEKNFEAYVNFVTKSGELWPQRDLLFEGVKLGKWVRSQRYQRSRDPEKIKKLTEIGFPWEEKDTWEENYALLQSFHSKYGHCHVPKNYTAESVKLGAWVSKQRWRKNNLTSQRVSKLERIDFIWSTRDYTWEKAFAALIDYKRSYGHCRVPREYSTDEINLGEWVKAQGQKKASMTSKRRDKLTAIGFVWK